MKWFADGAEAGPEAMARDLALLERAAGSCGRSHGWTRPTLTYGRGQRLPSELAADAGRAGIDLVRRPTGGGWLLHLPGDLAVSLARRGPLGPGAFRGAARLVAERLRAALAAAGAPVEIAPRAAGRPWRSDACFARLDESELVRAGAGEGQAGGVKVAGIALARIARAVLVQSALPLVPVPPGPVAEFAARWDPARAAAVARLANVERADLERAVRRAFGGESRRPGAAAGQINDASASRSES